MKKIYVFGNSLVDIDSLPIRLLPKLREEVPEYEFVELDPTEDMKPDNKEMMIIDTILNTNKVVLVSDIDKIEQGPAVSLHDFDLGYNLKIMKKFGMIEKVRIIGVPPDIGEDEAVAGIKKIIASLSLKSG